MNTSLHYKICVSEEYTKLEGNTIHLKQILTERYGFPVNVVLNNNDCTIPYFEALTDAGIEGAEEILGVLQEYSSIRLKEKD